MKARITFKNVCAFLQGHMREKLYYNRRLNWLLSDHIFEQISYRLFVMNKECLSNGECIMCGCSTPALQMANKTCEARCYPYMMDATDWHIYKREYSIEFKYLNPTRPRDFELRITKTTRK